MLRRLLLVAVAAAAIAVAGTPASAQSGFPGAPCVLETSLTPAEEVRTPNQTNDPTVESVARGRAWIVVLPGGTVWHFVVINNPARETFFAGHIHVAPAGTNGPVVVPLFEGNTNAATITDAGSHTVSAALANALCTRPWRYYVNYHTTQDPIGAIRGQLG